MSRSSGAQHGYTIAELLSTVFVMGLVMTAVGLTIGPLLSAQNQAQAKVDTVQAATRALYRVERDLRNTNLGSIWACTTGGTPSCAAPRTTLTATNAIVIATAYANGTGQFQKKLASGTPNWQGAAVYWVDATGNLDFAFDVPTATAYAPGNLLSATDAAAAVSDVTANGGVPLARSIQQMSLAVPNQGHQVSFQVQIQSTDGAASNETTFQTDLETRN